MNIEFEARQTPAVSFRCELTSSVVRPHVPLRLSLHFMTFGCETIGLGALLFDDDTILQAYAVLAMHYCQSRLLLRRAG